LNRQLLDGVAREDETAAKKGSDRGAPVSEAIIRDELVWASPGLAAVGVVCWHASIPQIHPFSAGAAGLVTHLPTLWWVGLVLVVAAVIVELVRESPRLGAMVVCIVAVALVLHGTLPASEVTPRFDSAYDIAGFADYIGRFGRTLPYADARMSWPAMMSATGMLARAMHVPTLWFARWAPLALNLAYLVPIKAIANVSLRTPRARWAVLPIFLASNWIDQDYFSPQAIGLLLFLTIVAITMRTFATRGEQPRIVRRLMQTKVYDAVMPPVLGLARLPTHPSPGELVVDDTTTVQRAAFFGLVLFLIAAVVVSHQFTPLALIVILLALSVAGRTRLKSLWLFVLVLVFAWLSWEAKIYWAGHLREIFGAVGSIGSSLDSSVGGRLNMVPSGRIEVQYARLAASLITWIGGALGFYVLWRRGRTLWTLAIVMVAPVFVAAGVNYGGEVALRILLFSLAPGAIFLAALLDAPSLRWPPIVACLVIVGLLVALFPVTRYGNEAFEAMAPGDVAAANWVHDHVPVGATVWVINGDNPLGARGIQRYEEATLPGPSFTSEASYETAISSVRPGDWIYLSRSQGEYGIYFQGDFPQNWIRDFAFWLVGSKEARIAHQTSTAYVLHVTAHKTTKKRSP
jgi:hypothetical protein